MKFYKKLRVVSEKIWASLFQNIYYDKDNAKE